MQSAVEAVKKIVETHDNVLFMKGTPEQPMCGFSSRVVQILDHTGAEFHAVNVLEDENIREAVKIYADWPTIPQLYVRGEFVGGCDIVTEMFQNGELKALFSKSPAV